MSWDKKKFNTLRSILRRAWSRFPERYAALTAAKRKYTGDNKRRKFEYECAECKAVFAQKEVQVDHKKPCGTLLKKSDIAVFVCNLFCDAQELQVLCKTCHNIKTQKERLEK